MENKINENVLAILRYKNGEIITDYEPIENYFTQELYNIERLCAPGSDNIVSIIIYLAFTPELRPLEKHYKYCVDLDGTYQGFTVNLNETANVLKENKLIFNAIAAKTKNFNYLENIENLKHGILKDFRLWVSAYNIEKAYRKCTDDKSILTFSHRKNGWASPVHHLSENFSVELKTNFGYGTASYFFIKLKYKTIDITPFSEWIDYEIARFSEIVRYTKSFAFRIYKGTYNGKRVYKRQIKNANWNNAIEYAKTACNCSLKSETDFLQKYIIEECEIMVAGLEDFAEITEFRFLGEDDNHYKVDKKGHYLMEFRGEKISGALNFITKILEFDKILEIKSFITRIETCNKKIHPLLIQELKIIEVERHKLDLELSIAKPLYLVLVEKNTFYKQQKRLIERQMIVSKILDKNNIDIDKVNEAFNDKYPEFKEFDSKFQSASENYRILNEQIENLNRLFENITSYNDKIINYFQPKAMYY